MTQQTKRVAIKVEFCDTLALVVPRGHRFEPVDDPYITNRVACRDCGMEGWRLGQRVHAYKRDIIPCTKTLN